MSNYLNEYIARFENMPNFNIHAVSQDGMRASPWYEVQATAIVRELVLDEINLGGQVQIITGEIQKWGRLLAQARRVWQLREREYRAWRSQFFLDSLKWPTPDKEDELPAGWTKTAKGDPKPPTKEAVEALYRVHVDYAKHQVAIEQAEESYNAVDAVYEAFKAKRDMLRHFAYRSRDSGQAQLSV